MPRPPKVDMHGVEVQLLAHGRVPFVMMETSSPFHGVCSCMLQTALESFSKVDGLYLHCSDTDIQRELSSACRLKVVDYMLAKVKQFPDVLAVGATKRSLLLALVLGLGLTGKVKTKKLWETLTEFDPVVASKFDELLNACWTAPQSKSDWWESDNGSKARSYGGDDDTSWGNWKDRSAADRSRSAPRTARTSRFGETKPETTGATRAASKDSGAKAKAAEERALKKPKMGMAPKEKADKINSFKEAVVDRQYEMDHSNQHDDRGDAWIGRAVPAAREGGTKRATADVPLVGRNTDVERAFMRFSGQPKPEDVRPLTILREALAKAQDRWKSQRDWSYVGEMLRSISQDLRVQHLHNSFAVEAHEYWAQVALESGDFRAFHTSAQELEAYYEDPELEKGAAKVKEILAWYILYMGIEGEGVSTSRFLQKHAKRLGLASGTSEKPVAPVVELALSIRRNMAQQRFLQVVTTLSVQPDAPMDGDEPPLIPSRLRCEMLRKAKLQALISLCKGFEKVKDLKRSRLESMGLLSKVDSENSELPVVFQDTEPDLVNTQATFEQARKDLEQHDKRQVLPTGAVRIVRRMGRQLNDHLNTFVRQNSAAAAKPQRKPPPRMVD